MEAQRLCNLIADRVQRRQRGHRLLKDDRNPAAADRPHLRAVARQPRDIDNLPVEPGVGEQDLAPSDDTAARKYP